MYAFTKVILRHQMNNLEFWNSLPTDGNVYLATSVIDLDFEKNYMKVRLKEGRLYSDDIVKNLPEIPASHPHCDEWKYRNYTCNMLLNYLSPGNIKKILDLGCGNGWFTNKIQQHTNAVVLGLDINKSDLKQAAEIFTQKQCKFIFGNIYDPIFPENYFDYIVLNASIQYFSSMTDLLRQLLKLLQSPGEIHILNSPVYSNPNKADLARQRSIAYFNSVGLSKHIQYYHHHSWDDFSAVEYQVMYDPRAIWSFLSRKILKKGSPFPWICIKK